MHYTPCPWKGESVLAVACIWCSVWHTGTVVACSRPACRVKLLSHSIPHVRIGTYTSYIVWDTVESKSLSFSIWSYIIKYRLFSLSLALSLSLSLYIYIYIKRHVFKILHLIYKTLICICKENYLERCVLWFSIADHSSNCSLFLKVWMQQHNWSTIQLKGVLNSPLCFWREQTCRAKHEPGAFHRHPSHFLCLSYTHTHTHAAVILGPHWYLWHSERVLPSCGAQSGELLFHPLCLLLTSFPSHLFVLDMKLNSETPRLHLFDQKYSKNNTFVLQLLQFKICFLFECILKCNLFLWLQSWIFSIHYSSCHCNLILQKSFYR